MASSPPRLRVLSVGGNAVSAFLSWRLQATNACDVTLVWKAGFDTVAQYGISIKSQALGNERFKPHAVVRSPEEAAQASKIPFDYVILCVKALPDVYDLATIVESVVTPQHTCILLNTTSSLGIEDHLEERYSTNVVLSMVCGAELSQVGPAEFEHKGQTSDIWVGWANKNATIPESIQKDMAEALAMTLSTAQVSCLVSLNIRQQQLEKMIGPIAFHPASVLFNTPNLSTLYDMPGVSPLINGVVDEMIQLAKAHGCDLPADFRENTIANYRSSTDTTSVMYQDFMSRRPMEVETYLGSSLRLAKKVGITLARIEGLYALLHDKNQKNLKGDVPSSPITMSGAMQHPLPRTSSLAPPGARPPPNGMPPNGMKNGRMGGRAPSMTNGGVPMPRRGPYGNGYGRMNGSVSGFPNGVPYSRRGSMDGNDLEDFSHVVLYDNADGLQDASSGSYGEPSGGTGTPSSSELALRERELALRQREIELREREHQMPPRRGPPPRRQPRPPPHGMFDDDEDEDDYFDPMSGGQAPMGAGDDNIDMLSITSRRHRKMPSAGGGFNQAPPRSGKGAYQRNNRSSSRAAMHDVPSPHESIMNNSLLGYSSNRYGTVERQALEAESRHNSISNARMEELARGPGGQFRRTSQPPGNPLHLNTNGMRSAPALNGRPSPPGMRLPMPRHPSAHGNGVAPQPVEQHVGVSTLYPLKEAPQVRNLTGSASASPGSGDSLSAKTGSDSSANSSASSLPSQPRNGVRPADGASRV